MNKNLVQPTPPHNFSYTQQSAEVSDKSEALLNQFFETNSSTMLLINPDTGLIADANQAACAFYGYSHAELCTMPIANLSTLSQEQVLANLTRVKTGQLSHFDFQHRLAGGQIRQVEVYSSPIIVNHHFLLCSTIHDVTERKQAEAALKIERNFAAAVLDTVGALVIVLDPHGRIVRFNRACEQLTGYDFEEVRGRIFWEIVLPPELVEEVRLIFNQLVKSGFPNKHINEWFSRTNQRRLISWSNTAITGSTGQVEYVIATGIDITEHQQVDTQMRQQTWAIEQSPASIVITDTSGAIEYVNPKFTQVTGYTLDEVQGKNPRILKSGRMPPETYKHLWEAITLGQEWRGEFYNKKKSGELYWELASISPVTDALGKITHFLAFKEDITERKRAEETLRQQKEILQSILDNVPLMIGYFDPQGKLQWVNQAWEQGLGWSLAEIQQTKELLQEIYPDPKYRQQVLDFIQATSGEWADFKTKVRDGRTLDTTWANIGLSDGSRIGIGQDVTDRKKLEREFLQAQKLEAIGRLSGGIAHDFNNILTAMMGYVGLALRNLPAESPARRELEGIQESAKRAATLTRQLLAFARKQPIETKPVSLNDLVLNIDKMVRRLIGEDIELVTLLDPGLQWIQADPGQLEHMLVNLVVNARDAMSVGGKLIIQTTNVTLEPADMPHLTELNPGEYALLTLTDTGVGMTDEVKAHLFEPFFTTKEVGKGTGLGLATCFGIVKQNKGHIQIESELNQGTTIKIYLPQLKIGPVTASSLSETDNLPQGKEQILLVEDEPIVRRVASRLLRQLGYSVQEATNGEEALRMVQDNSEAEFDLLLTDMIMPRMGGRELAELIKKRWPDVKILFTSGYTDETVMQLDTPGQGIAFLQKPFSPANLAHKVREVLDSLN